MQGLEADLDRLKFVFAHKPLKMAFFRAAVFHHGGVPENCQLALMGRFSTLMDRFPTLMGRFSEFLNGPLRGIIY